MSPIQLLQVGPCRWGGVPLLRSGVAAPPARSSPIPPGESSFEFFFQPILGSMSGYWWIDPPLYQGNTSLDAGLQAALRLVTDGWAPPGILLPRFAHYMLEDWCECVGLLEKPTNADALRLEFVERGRPFWESDLGFRNVDGAFWLMHSRDHSLTECVAGYLSKIPGTTVSWETIGETG